VQVVGPGSERVLADQGPLGQALGGGLVGQAGGAGDQVEVEGVQQGGGTRCVPLVGGEVLQGAGDQGWEVVGEVGGLDGAAGALQGEVVLDGEVEEQGQVVAALGDGLADGGGDERGAVGVGEAVGEEVLAVLGGEVADQYLPDAAGAGAGGGRVGAGGGYGAGGQAGPGGGAGVVELPGQGLVGPLQPVAAADDEQHVGHQPDDVLQQPLGLAVGAVADVLEGVQQHHRDDGFAGRDLGEFPGEQVGVVGQRSRWFPVHDSEHSDDVSHSGGEDNAATAEEARERVLRVVSWYSGQALAARRAGRTEETERLLAGQRACKADLQALEEAGEAEAARIANRYARLYRELTGEA
jgi:hypothetical protein